VLQKAVPTQNVTNPVILPSFLLCAGYFSPLWFYAILLHFSHDRSNWSATSNAWNTEYYCSPYFMDI